MSRAAGPQRALLAWATVLALLVAGCGRDDGGDPTPSGTAPSGTVTSSGTPTAAETGGSIDGTFDVGGHSLYLSCEGTKAPTIVYLHGAITDANLVPHQSADAIQRALADQYRVCLYDRRNLGNSDTVDAAQRPEDAMNDLHSLLAAAKVEPPYVLLGASFGGLLAYLYANTNPDDVVGMVLLDSMFPDELKVESLVPAKERYVAYDAEDENASLERISHYKALKAAERYIGKEPAIPVTYLASIPEGYEKSEFGEPYNTKIVPVQQGYVDRFVPGVLRKVDAPHYMEPVIPDQIAEELRLVITTARSRTTPSSTLEDR